MYDPEKIRIPANFVPEHPFYFGIDPKIGEDRDENLAAHPRSEQEIRRHIAAYYAMISHIDENVGRLLDCLLYTSMGIWFRGFLGGGILRRGLIMRTPF